MTKHFHRVGKKIAVRFLKYAGIDIELMPRNLQPATIILLAKAMKQFTDFLPPDIRCLSPLGKSGMIVGIKKGLNPEEASIHYSQRPASAYNGHPFIVEVAMAYGGSIPKAEDFTLYRFANRIPLLYDTYNDVTMRVIRNIKWNRYGITPLMPIAIFVHIASTKIPFKTVGKEYIADRPEIRYEIEWGLKDCARGLKKFLMGKQRVKNQYRRFNVYQKYLPKLAQFATELAQEPHIPDLTSLLREK
jgi:DNA topoisomerase-6 subunit B